MFGIGSSELLVVAVIALLLFGNRLPSVMRSLGSGISEFKKGLDDINRQVNNELMADVHSPSKSETSEPVPPPEGSAPAPIPPDHKPDSSPA
jgi:sec-independent protein translocase protein TatA